MADRVVPIRQRSAFLGVEVAARSPRTRTRGQTDRLYRLISAAMAATDGLTLQGAVVLASILRFGAMPGGGRADLTFAIIPFLTVAVFGMFHLYELSRLSPAEEFRRIIAAISLATVVRIGVVAAFTDGGVVVQKWAGITLLLSVSLVLAERFAWHKYMGHLRRTGELSYRVLVLGANEEAVRIAEGLGSTSTGFLPLGLVRVNGEVETRGPHPILGTIEDLPRLVEQEQVECVFVASSALPPALSQRVVRQLSRMRVDVRFSANVMEIMSSRLMIHPVGNLLALSLRPVKMSGPKAAAKRTFDLAVGLFLIVLSLPIGLAAAIAIRCTSPGPVFFRQQRVGRHARSFTMYKFRTMVEEAESLLSGLACKNEASGPLFKIRSDPRITQVGRLLRRFSLDELPQLLNVVRGEMSLIGPRPPLPREVASYEDWHMDRLEVRPGITGLWQVGRRSDWSFDDYVRLDLFYIENWSIAYDLFIMLKTLPAVLRARSNC